MTNPYFVRSFEVLQGSANRSDAVEAEFSAVEAGFDGVTSKFSGVDANLAAAIAAPNGETLSRLPAAAARKAGFLMFNSATGQPEISFSLATASAGALGIFGNGTNVGVGTYTPTAKLHVVTSAPAAMPTWFSADSAVVSASTNAVLQLHAGASGGTLAYAFSLAGTRSVAAMAYDTTSGTLYWTNNAGTERMRLDASGNLGVGAASPNAGAWSKALTVDGALNSAFECRVGGTYQAYFAAGGSSVVLGAVGALPLMLRTNGNDRIAIDASGNVGVGTTGPTARLHVARDDTVGTQIMRVQNLNGTRYSSAMEFTSAPGADWRIGKGSFSQDQDFGIGLASGTELVRISAGGNLLLGTQTQIPGATARFVADYSVGDCIAVLRNSHATTPYGLKIQYTASPNNTGQQFLYCSDGTTVRFYVASNGNVYNVSGAIGAISDLKLKQNISDCTPKLADLMRVRIVNYSLKSEPATKLLGVIAQELEAVFPGMVESTPDYQEVERQRVVSLPAQVDEDGTELKPASESVETFMERVPTGEVTKSVKYSVFVPMLVKAVQELAQIVAEQGARIQALEARA